jgi:autotransporter-associated beta strand protein
MKLRYNPTRLLAFLAGATAALAQTTYTWTGANSTAPISNYVYSDGGDPRNWQGNTLPPFATMSGDMLTFGGARDSSVLYNFVSLPTLDVLGLVFTTPRPTYSLYVSSGNLRLGAGGITAPGNESQLGLTTQVYLTANQIWSVDNLLVVNGDIYEATPGVQLTKMGPGELLLNGSEGNFSGGLNILGGTLALANNSTPSGSGVSGPAGAGQIYLADGTRLRANTNGNLTLHNPLSLGNGVTLGDYRSGVSLNLYGTITPLQDVTRVNLAVDGAVFFRGNLVNQGSTASSFIFQKSSTSSGDESSDYNPDSFPVAVLGGNNTYSGGTIASGAGVIFFAPSALPSSGAIEVVNSGYVGSAYNGGLTSILSRITSPAAFNGSLGLDTDPDSESGPGSFDDTINLASFSRDSGPTSGSFWGLGSLTFARLTGNSSITPPNGGNYLFGGGEGTLFVGTNLGVPANSPSAGIRVRTPFGDRPLTVYLQGNNTFTGNILVDHSVVVLDSPTALPANVSFGLDSQAYISFTENSGLTPNQFISRLNPSGYNHDSILGFDYSPGNTEHGVTLTGAVNLSGLNNLFLGTITHAHLAGEVRAPSTGTLSLTGLKGGWLTIDSALQPTYPSAAGPVSGVTSVRIGQSTSNDIFQASYVELANSGSTYTGGTTFQNGYLLVGGSSTLQNGAITSGPVGTGTLSFSSNDYGRPATLIVTNSDGVTLHNNIAIDNGATARFGVPHAEPGNNDDPASRLGDFSSNALTLAGNLSGQAGYISFVGNAAFTLSGDNSSLHAGQIAVGSSGILNSTRLVVANQNALGDGNTPILLHYGSDLQFAASSATPVSFTVAGIEGGTPPNADTDNYSHLVLENGDSLTFDQFYDTTLFANIGGPRSDWTNGPVAATTASLIKNGTGTLTLGGDSAFSGGLTINGGRVIAASYTALGTGNVTINGGTLGVANFVTVSNPILFGPAGATLSGNATFTTPITAGANVTLAPGNSPGALTFTNGLTLASGGTLSIDIVDLSLNAGTGYDTINVTGGTLNLTATTANPFTIEINSLSALTNSLGALTTSVTPAALTILQTPTAITGLIGDGTAGTSNLVLQTSNFTAYQQGLFSLSLGGLNNSALILNFTPVPEPSTYALIGLGLAFVGWQLHRRRRVR